MTNYYFKCKYCKKSEKYYKIGREEAKMLRIEFDLEHEKCGKEVKNESS